MNDLIIIFIQFFYICIIKSFKFYNSLRSNFNSNSKKLRVNWGWITLESIKSFFVSISYSIILLKIQTQMSFEKFSFDLVWLKLLNFLGFEIYFILSSKFSNSRDFLRKKSVISIGSSILTLLSLYLFKHCSDFENDWDVRFFESLFFKFIFVDKHFLQLQLF